jgi:uncharacterized protein YigE (DUF2233 family)
MNLTSPDRSRITGVIRVIVGCLALTGLIGCNLTRVTETKVLLTPDPSTPKPHSPWDTIAQGVERREMSLPTLSQTSKGKAVLVRIDPAIATIRVHYSPGSPRSLTDWRDQLTGAAVILNGAFFDESDQALGLLVSDGNFYGQSFAGFGGMFQVSESGVRVRSLVGEPYLGEALWQAVQGFPMLIEAGGIMAPQGDGFDQRSNRTWAGQDRSGRIIFGMTQNLVSLADLQTWLIGTDLDLYIAFGLDGGRSTGMIINTPGHDETYLPLDKLPSVIAVYAP